ncbi:MAG: hypothetical protein LBK52_01630 [Deltaproteobacteria bacterium]|jgi:OOP family OmpA-OmpF porin|nr:hypothetical protein [Deltaproteobacteria bacterium]
MGFFSRLLAKITGSQRETESASAPAEAAGVWPEAAEGPDPSFQPGQAEPDGRSDPAQTADPADGPDGIDPAEKSLKEAEPASGPPGEIDPPGGSPEAAPPPAEPAPAAAAGEKAESSSGGGPDLAAAGFREEPGLENFSSGAAGPKEIGLTDDAARPAGSRERGPVSEEDLLALLEETLPDHGETVVDLDLAADEEAEELKKTGILDEPLIGGLTPEELEQKLLNDLDNFFQDVEAIEENFDRSDSSRFQIPAEDFSDWESRFADDTEDENLEDEPALWPPLPEKESDLGKVRDLLVGRELTQLSYLTRVLTRPAQRAEFISRVVTEALLLRTRRDEKLNTVLASTVEKIVSASVRRDPETLASQIFPAIGPAIRRSISETFVSKLQDLNSTLEKSLSLRGIKWRLEAMRVHKPFSEIVLLHTLLYHVEEIYLIHAGSGLVLDHLISEESGETRDADQVAGMFTAIQDFIRDSFQMAKSDSLDTLRFGDRSIFLRRTSQVYLACVVRGNPPESLNKDLQEALELMVVDCAEELENFNGDTAPFKKCRIYFQDFLRAQYHDKSRKLPLIFWLSPLILIFFLLIFGAVSYFQDQKLVQQEALLAEQRIQRREWRENAKKEDRQRFQRALELVNTEPGLVVALVSDTPAGRWNIVCLKDTLARDPAEILIQEGRIQPDRFELNIRPFISLDEEIVRKRVQEVIRPLPTVSLDFDSQTGELAIRGTAPLGWIMEARDRALAIPGVQRVALGEISDPRSSEMERLLAAVNGVVIHFPTNKEDPVPEDLPVLVKAVDNLVVLEKLASEMQMSVNLVIYGLADSTGQDRRNYELSQLRTKTVAALLYGRGSSMPISNYGLGSRFSARGEGDKPLDDPDSRRIELRVRLAQGAYGETGRPAWQPSRSGGQGQGPE